MLLCLVKGRLEGEFGEVVIHPVGEVALEAADGFAFGLALCEAAGDIRAGGRVVGHAHDRHGVQRTVGLAVAAGVEPVTELLAGRGVQRRDPAQVREGPFAVQPFGVVAGGDQQRGGDVGADTLFGEQVGGGSATRVCS
jgi:hypothetical protein